MNAGADAAKSDALALHRVRAMLAQARRVTLPMLALALFIGAFVWRSVPHTYVIGWVLAVATTLALRWFGLRRLLRVGGRSALRRAVVFSAINAVVHGASSWLFLPSLSLESKAVLTMFIVSQSATALATSGFYLPAFRLYSYGVLLQVSIVWLLLGIGAPPAGGLTVEPLYAVVAVFSAMLAFVQEGFARRSEQTFVESSEIRYQNDQLLRDLERKQAELAAERDRAEAASRAKSRFLAAASHDLRQPMHTLSLLSGALMLGELPLPARGTAEKMEEAVAALSSQLDGLLDVSKLDAGIVEVRKQPTLLAPLFERLESDFTAVARNKGLEITILCDAELAVATDRRHLERILRNLIDNALKYTERGGVTVSAGPDGKRVRIAVCDSGIGIPADERERVFEEFYQLNNPERDRACGLGLGLAIVRRLCRLLDIELALRSAPGTGTEIDLRLDPAFETVAESETIPSRRSLAGTNVLVVDDEVAVRESTQRLLEALGCRVALADGVSEALRAADRHQFDIVLADYRLRGLESGLELIGRLRMSRPGLPALLVSGDTLPERLKEAAAHDIELLHKPLGPEALTRAIAAALQPRGDE